MLNKDTQNQLEKIPATQRAEWLMTALDSSILYMNSRRDTNRKRAVTVKIVSVILSATGAALLGLNITGFDVIFRNIAFVFITAVTLLNALEPFFNFRSLWIEQESALAGFYLVKDDLQYYLAGIEANAADEQKIKEFYSAYRQVWDKHNAAWITHRKSDTALSLPSISKP